MEYTFLTQLNFAWTAELRWGMKKDVYHVAADGLVGRVRGIIRDSNVKRIVVKG